MSSQHHSDIPHSDIPDELLSVIDDADSSPESRITAAQTACESEPYSLEDVLHAYAHSQLHIYELGADDSTKETLRELAEAAPSDTEFNANAVIAELETTTSDGVLAIAEDIYTDPSISDDDKQVYLTELVTEAQKTGISVTEIDVRDHLQSLEPDTQASETDTTTDSDTQSAENAESQGTDGEDQATDDETEMSDTGSNTQSGEALVDESPDEWESGEIVTDGSTSETATATSDTSSPDTTFNTLDQELGVQFDADESTENQSTSQKQEEHTEEVDASEDTDQETTPTEGSDLDENFDPFEGGLDIADGESIEEAEGEEEEHSADSESSNPTVSESATGEDEEENTDTSETGTEEPSQPTGEIEQDGTEEPAAESRDSAAEEANTPSDETTPDRSESPTRENEEETREDKTDSEPTISETVSWLATVGTWTSYAVSRNESATYQPTQPDNQPRPPARSSDPQTTGGQDTQKTGPETATEDTSETDGTSVANPMDREPSTTAGGSTDAPVSEPDTPASTGADTGTDSMQEFGEDLAESSSGVGGESTEDQGNEPAATVNPDQVGAEEPEGIDRGPTDDIHTTEGKRPEEVDETQGGLLDVPNYAQDLLNFEYVFEENDPYLPDGVSGEGMVKVSDDQYVAIARVTARSWSIHTDQEKADIINQYQSNFLASLEFPVQIVSYPTKFDITEHIERLEEVIDLGRSRDDENPLVTKGRRLYPNWLEAFIKENEMREREFYLIIPVHADKINKEGQDSNILDDLADKPGIGKIAKKLGADSGPSASRKRCLRELSSRFEPVERGLRRMGVGVEPLEDRDQVMSVLYHYYNNYKPEDEVFPSAPFSVHDKEAKPSIDGFEMDALTDNQYDSSDSPIPGGEDA